jgi:hypothetical protein
VNILAPVSNTPRKVKLNLTLHRFPPHLVYALVVGGMEDIFLVRRLNHADVAEVVDEEAANASETVHTRRGNDWFLP